jgi:peptidoglycan/LPS O-acetylase OafA/YrhL
LYLENLNQNRIHFFNLDVLRCMAAGMVVILHGWHAYEGWVGIPECLAGPDGKTWNAMGTYLTGFIDNFDLGVEFFFLISGFLITYLLLKEKATRNSIHIGKFYIRRALRIWPLYFLVVVISPLLIYYSGQSPPDYKWVLTFTTNFEVINTGQWYYPFGHFWSIAIEEHFYLFWPWLIAFIPARKMPLLFSGIIFLSLSFRIYMSFINPEWYNHAYLNTLCRIDVMAIGGFIAWWHMRSPIVINISKGIRIMFYLVALYIFIIEPNKQVDKYFTVGFKKYIYVMIFLFGFLNYLFNPDSFLNFRKKNILHYLGKISFGIYIYHNLFFKLLAEKIVYPNEIKSPFIYWLIYLGITLGAAILSYELIEQPVLKLKDRFALIKTYR